MHSAEWHLSPFAWLRGFLENGKHRGFGKYLVAREIYKRATVAASGPDRPEGEKKEHVLCLPCPRPHPRTHPVLCATVFMSILLCCCNFFFAPFSSFEFAHWGPKHKAAALWEGGGVFDVKAKVVWRD